MGRSNFGPAPGARQGRRQRPAPIQGSCSTWLCKPPCGTGQGRCLGSSSSIAASSSWAALKRAARSFRLAGLGESAMSLVSLQGYTVSCRFHLWISALRPDLAPESLRRREAKRGGGRWEESAGQRTFLASRATMKSSPAAELVGDSREILVWAIYCNHGTSFFW